MSDKKNTYSSPPKPIKLKAPEFPEGYEPPKRGRGILPQLDSKPVGMPGRKTAPPEEKGLEAFRAAQRSYGAPREADEHRRRMPPPPPQIRPGDFPKRQRPGEPIKGAKAQPQRIRRTPSFIQHVLQIKINPLYVSVAAWSVVVIALGAFAVWFVSGLFVDNAYAVYLDGEFIGFISMHDDELTSEEVHQNAVLSLQAARGGVRVQVQETITIEPTRAPASERQASSDIFAITTRLFTFTIAAIEIHVNGEFEARMRTEADLEEVERLLHEEYRNDNTVGSEFVSGWETIIVQVNLEETEFFTPLEAYYRLDRTTLQPYEYIVKDRDTLGSIALSFGTTVNRIMLDNNLTSTLIRPGDLLTINTNLPLLAVRTFDDYRTPELIEMPVDTRYTDELPLHESRIVQQGQQGQQMTVERVTRVNNMEVSREMREPEITIEPVPHIVEVGTGAAAMERR